MPRPLPLSAATGGLAAALVNSLFQPVQEFPVLPPVTCQDLGLAGDLIHWPSLLLGLLVGLLPAQVLELLLLCRQCLSALVRHGWLPICKTLASGLHERERSPC